MPGLLRKEVAAAAALVAACWLLALASALAGRGAGPLCAQDRVPLKPRYQVDVVPADGATLRLCNVTCAALFLRGNERPVARVVVRDEETGAPLDPAAAFFVESEVFTHRESSNRTHVFGSLADAEEHARLYRGRRVPNPFAPRPD